MAVYQGARLPASSIGARRAPAARPQASGREQVVARARVRPASVLLLLILAATLLGFAYLTQTLDSTATGVEVRQLRTQASELQRRIKSQEALVLSEASSGNIRDRAMALGLSERSVVTIQAP
ncbi:hypothetical protein BH23CHL8_BH23CHL8_18790 [soil metagenome]